ncbi:NeuD/PglB/VioB family sugar acetyltransferase [Microbacterium sufflavum]|uniref:NeuD/PglB/VioB family sugar acetyltransferase n=1 Tax=Microbacterium sufflavum TaxID=2851649 RepID=A0ABY4II83_9MICO|nr:NeuD/PglB/VioB family sugar acetyltransferase [Microbacterium sufflavum]MCK2026492.1 NeuD/PglB/VioB family sugar acetyltransferase [Microbacterium sufflavum]UPL11288.1 NeuD/PglB/VioB family sugar acetyltransferase [Microbacterium sufflavum]
MTGVVVIGAGGFGREILDVLRDQGRVIHGVVDDALTAANAQRLQSQGVRYLGSTERFLRDHEPAGVEYLIGIGDGAVRQRIDHRLTRAGHVAGRVSHSAASWGFGVDLGPGAVVCAGVRLTTNISTGRHVHLNVNATIGHDVRLDDYVSVNPGAAVSGSVAIGERTLVGANAFILQGIRIGEDSIVGASASVLRKVASRTTVVGNPARVLARREAP